MSYYGDYGHTSPGPPLGPPPPLPAGWYQEWEPTVRRAFWVEHATGRSQWEAPYAPQPGKVYYDGSRSVPPHETAGGYYGPPAGPPPGGYEERGYGHQGDERSNAGKYLAAGAAGLAVGGIAGAVIAHEVGEY